MEFKFRPGVPAPGRFRTLKAAGILAYLAYHRRNHSRELLIETFWPEADLESARHSLSMALSSLRTALEPPGVPAGSLIVGFSPRSGQTHCLMPVNANPG